MLVIGYSLAPALFRGGDLACECRRGILHSLLDVRFVEP